MRSMPLAPPCTSSTSDLRSPASMNTLLQTVHVTSGFVQPGSANHQVLEMTNVSGVALELHAGVRICQIVLQRCEGSAVYRGQYADQDAP